MLALAVQKDLQQNKTQYPTNAQVYIMLCNT